MTLAERLIDKSKEAFIMAIEVYNKPTIRYRLEGFSFFICNAWELMLKAHIINKFGETEIYYADKPDRTISLEKCIQKIFTNEKAPLRQNLTKIIELRNTSTHFITEEYEMVYVPLLQACVFNFVEKMNEFHGVDMSKIIPDNFITLSVSFQALDETEIRAKYPRQIAERLVNIHNTLSPMIAANNNNFAIRIEHHYFQTKDRHQATELYHIDNTAAEGIRIVKELKDPNQTHKYNAKNVIAEINKRLKRDNIVLIYNGLPKEFNSYWFRLFVDYFNMKSNPRYCYAYHVTAQPMYSYSAQAIDFIMNEIKKAPDRILDDLKRKVKKSANPGSKGF